MIRENGERRHSLALAVLAVAGIWLGGGPVAFAQAEEPVPADDPHPAEVEQQETPRAEFGKDEAPTTTVVVGEDEGGLIEAYTIEFGDEKDWAQLASGEWLRVIGTEADDSQRILQSAHGASASASVSEI